MMKTVLITGGAGFIGSHLCKKYLDEDWRVVCVDNLGSGSMQNIDEFVEEPKFKFIQHNIIEPLETEKTNLIMHFASRASPPDYQKYPFETLLTNSRGTYNMLKKAKEDDARFIMASTSEVYGDAKIIPTPETYWGNVNSYGPRSCYDESKRFAEALCYEFNKKMKVDTRILRIFNTYGPSMRKNDGRVITNFMYQALNNKPLTVYGKGEQTRSFCHIKDMINGIYKTSIKKDISGEVFNLGNPKEYKIIEIAHLIKDLTKSKSKIVYKELPKDDPMRRVPDITKAKKILDWNPEINLKQGLKKMMKEVEEEWSQQ